jgi:predicted nucleic acid-binding protein
MAGLDPTRVLLDSTFIAALINHDEPFHADAVAEYADLLDRYERDEVLLTATSDSLNGLPPNVRASLLAPLDELRIAEQHRNASLDVAGSSGDDPDFATLLVLIEREGVDAVASFDARFDRFALEVRPPRRPAASAGPAAPAQ